jgi:hypothetical protein
MVAVTLSLLVMAGCQQTPKHRVVPVTDWSRAGLVNPEMEARWGVRVIDIRPTAAGYMLHFRYRVLDAAKAEPLFNREVIPYLIDEKSKAQLMIPSPPLVGPLRQTAKQLKDQRNYFMLFANPDKMVKPDDKVTVVIGDFRAEHLIVK